MNRTRQGRLPAVALIVLTFTWVACQAPALAQRSAHGGSRGGSVSRGGSASHATSRSFSQGPSRGGSSSRGSSGIGGHSSPPTFRSAPSQATRSRGGSSSGKSLPSVHSNRDPISHSTRQALSATRTGSSRQGNSPSLNRNDIASRIDKLRAARVQAARQVAKTPPPSIADRKPPSNLHRGPNDHSSLTTRDKRTAHAGQDKKKSPPVTPYRSMFEPRRTSPGSAHGTPRYDQRRHDYTTYDHKRRHGNNPLHRPDIYHFGRYGYVYRGPGLRVYLGDLSVPWYGYGSTTYYERYYVPYYIPYEVPTPYVVEEVVEPAVTEPVVVEQAVPSSSTLIPTTDVAEEYQLAAERAFLDQRFEDAARAVNHALVEDSGNGKLHLFASQVFFALGDYESAAAAVQQAASLLDRSEWGHVVENYKQFYRGTTYVDQMDQLDEFLVKNPDAAYGYFLRGYHFLYLGHKEAASKDLAKAVQLESRDRLAAELLTIAGGQPPEVIPALPPTQESPQ